MIASTSVRRVPQYPSIVPSSQLHCPPDTHDRVDYLNFVNNDEVTDENLPHRRNDAEADDRARP